MHGTRPDATSPDALQRRGYAYALKLTGDPERARELVQEAWVSCLAAGGAPRSFGYLAAAIRSRHFDGLRRAHYAVLPDADVVAGYRDEAASSEAVVGSRLAAEKALELLSDAEREAILLTAEGCTAREVAERTGRPRGTILSLLHRARTRVRAGMALALLALVALLWPERVRIEGLEEILGQATAAEITARHSKGRAPEQRADSAADLRLALSFTPVDSPRVADLTFVGGRTCSVQGVKAAQMTLRDAEGRRWTLYQAPLDETLEAVPVGTVSAGGRSVVQWREGGLFMGLVGPN